MRYLSKKEKKQLNEELNKELQENYQINPNKDIITEKNNILYKNGNKFLIIKQNDIDNINKKSNLYLPHLNSVDENSKFKSVFIDKGAIPFIIKGADLMKPGITKFDEDIKKNDIIIIKDENHNKNLAIGHSLLSSKELKKQEKGKSIIIYHYFNDEYY